MLIAEALDERKKLRDSLDTLQGLQIVVDEDDDADEIKTFATAELERLDATLGRIRELTVEINRRNNEAKIEFEGESISLMEAIALRDRLMAEHRFYDGLIEGVETILGIGSSRVGLYGRTRRSKDDIKQLAVIEPRVLRATRDSIASTVARLDIEVQKANWSVKL